MGKLTNRNIISLISILLLAQVFITGCQLGVDDRQVDPVSKNTKQLVLDIKNEDVKWDGNLFGLMPRTLNGATLALRDVEEPIEPLLIEAILDEKRYVAAHVLLTLRSEGTFTSSEEGWNDLHVQLFADGTVTYEANNLWALHQKWTKELANKGK